MLGETDTDTEAIDVSETLKESEPDCETDADVVTDSLSEMLVESESTIVGEPLWVAELEGVMELIRLSECDADRLADGRVFVSLDGSDTLGVTDADIAKVGVGVQDPRYIGDNVVAMGSVTEQNGEVNAAVSHVHWQVPQCRVTAVA